VVDRRHELPPGKQLSPIEKIARAHARVRTSPKSQEAAPARDLQLPTGKQLSPIGKIARAHGLK
jgi:hypothetical protein